MSLIMIVEDDRTLNEGIAYALRKEGYEVIAAASLGEARRLLTASPDLILLDVGLPDGNGWSFLREFRRTGSLPVIFLTARDSERDMVKGFEAGCDDYLAKPFSMAVLLGRIKAVMRRTGGAESEIYRAEGLVYSFSRKELVKDGAAVKLTATEIRLLELLIRNKDQVLTRGQIMEKVWDEGENFVEEKALNVNISRLREKIGDDPKNPRYIRTVFGIGYKWNDRG